MSFSVPLELVIEFLLLKLRKHIKLSINISMYFYFRKLVNSRNMENGGVLLIFSLLTFLLIYYLYGFNLNLNLNDI